MDLFTRWLHRNLNTSCQQIWLCQNQISRTPTKHLTESDFKGFTNGFEGRFKAFLDFVIHVVDGRQKHVFRGQDILPLARKEIKASLHLIVLLDRIHIDWTKCLNVFFDALKLVFSCCKIFNRFSLFFGLVKALHEFIGNLR